MVTVTELTLEKLRFLKKCEIENFYSRKTCSLYLEKIHLLRVAVRRTSKNTLNCMFKAPLENMIICEPVWPILKSNGPLP